MQARVEIDRRAARAQRERTPGGRAGADHGEGDFGGGAVAVVDEGIWARESGKSRNPAN